MFLRESDPDESRRRFTRRAMVLAGLQGVGFAVLGARLYQLQVMEGRLYTLLAEDNRITVQGLQPWRGRIFDRLARPLADNRDIFRAEVIPAEVVDLPALLEAFARVYPLPPSTRQELLEAARTQTPRTPMPLATDLSWQDLARINVEAPQLPGVRTTRAAQRRYHGGIAMGHLVGYTGAVERHALDDNPAHRIPGSMIGKAGVEAGAEPWLQGRAGYVRQEVDAHGRILRELEHRDPERGKDVVLTVNADVQAAIAQRLIGFRRAAITVLHAETGEIAAMVSVPGYDPVPFADGISPAEWTRLVADRDKPFLDRNIQGQYPPGSTFKMVAALAALHHGVVDPDEKIICTGAIELAGQTFRCWNRTGHGPCDLHRSLRESCDVYYYEIARRVGITRIAEMGRMLGLGQIYPIGLDQQAAGLMPDPDWKRGALGQPWYDGETLIAGIGQGYVLATPLQLAVMMARLTTARAIVPSLVRRTPFEPPKAAGLDIEPAHIKRIQSALHAVVNERHGTGHAAASLIEGLTIAGKTGTSQVSRLSAIRAPEDIAWKYRDHAIFVGVIADERPRYVASAIIEHGGSGGKVAAPLVREVLTDVYQADPSAEPVRWPGREPA